MSTQSEHIELARLIMGRTTTTAVKEILAAGYRKQPHVTITPCDPEAYARGHNDGYEAAIAQGLADDPTLADDWLQAKLRDARAQALEDAADADRTCPTCGAKEGKPCYGNGPMRSQHPSRGISKGWLRARAAAERSEQ